MTVDEKTIHFTKWMLTNSKEVSHTVAPCRRYSGEVYTIEEMYQIYLKKFGQ
jgi:hypothetical protein